MCGISGIVSKEPMWISENHLKVLLFELQHRGPDGYGVLFYTENQVYIANTESEALQLSTERPYQAILAQRRLSIIDLSIHGRQPMSDFNDRYFIVYNGEVYNYLELKSSLQSFGYEFISDSDTEVLLYAYIHWGEKCLNKLVGMFTLCILDKHSGEFFIARDFCGIKPLFYTQSLNKLYFSSEINLLLKLGVSRAPNRQRVFEYLRYGFHAYGSQTMFQDIKQFVAASFVTFRMRDLNLDLENKLCQYWKPSATINYDLSFDEAAQQVKDTFLNNVELHMRSDVPIGVALSGGIDSSSIVMAIRMLDGNADLNTFSYIDENYNLNEERWIDIVATQAGAISHKVRLQSGNLLDDLAKLIRVQGEPFISTSIYAQYKVFERAKTEGIKVMLDGQGADEMFGGYTFYYGSRMVSLFKRSKISELLELAYNLNKRGKLIKSLYHAQKYLAPKFFLGMVNYLYGTPYPKWMKKEWFLESAVQNKTIFERKYTKFALKDSLSESLHYRGLSTLLHYEDHNSMAHSVESRVPFLTPNLIELTNTFPEEFFIDKMGTTKSVLKAAMRGIVPDEILDRRDKLGFNTSEGDWLRGNEINLINSIIEDDELGMKIPFLKPKRVQTLWQGFLNSKHNSSPQMWRIINLIMWSQIYEIDYNDT